MVTSVMSEVSVGAGSDPELRAEATAVSAVLIDDHQVVLEGLTRTLQRDGISVVGTFGDGDSALAFLRTHPVDLVVVDLRLQNRSGLAVVDAVHRMQPDTKIAVLTSFEDRAAASAAVHAGASGYLTRSLDPSRLPHVVRGALRGEPAVPRRFVARLLEELRTRERRRSVVLEGKGRVALTQREWEVVELLLRGRRTAEIAEQLGVAPVTVRRHVGSVERKLGVETRAEVVELLAAQAG